MLTGAIAEQLRSRGHDVVAVTGDNAMVGLSDDQILDLATAAGRTVVTANIRDFVPLDRQWRADGRRHGGLVLVSTKTFPQDRGFVGALVSALDALLTADGVAGDAVVFLPR